MSDDRERFLAWRGVETPCKACGGAGQRCYGSTAGWRGGAGGQMLTNSVCDYCWGSGDADRPGTDLRALEQRARKAETEAESLAIELKAATNPIWARLEALAEQVVGVGESLVKAQVTRIGELEAALLRVEETEHHNACSAFVIVRPPLPCDCHVAIARAAREKK